MTISLEVSSSFEICLGSTSSGDVLWFDVKLHQIFQVFGSLYAFLSLLCGSVSLGFFGKVYQLTRVDGGDPGGVRKGQTQNLKSGSHRVGTARRTLGMDKASRKSAYVNIPPQAPDPGQALRITSKRSSSEIFPVAYAPVFAGP